MRRDDLGMQRNLPAEFEASLIGRRCTAHRREHDWNFDLAEGFALSVSVPWRIVLHGRIALASTDDGQMFGRTSPIDAEIEARRLLGSTSITRAVVDLQTADFELHFGADVRLDVFHNSLGYEGWQASYAYGDSRWSVIALGGGELAFMQE